MGNFYLAITHLVSVFNEAGGKICLLHIEVKTTKSEGIYSIIVNGKLANKFLVQQLHIEQPYTYTTTSHRTTLYIYNTFTSNNPIHIQHLHIEQPYTYITRSHISGSSRFHVIL